MNLGITTEQYFKDYPEKYPEEFTEEIQKNGQEVVEKVSELLDIWGGYTEVSSGWRPAAHNATVHGAAKKSNHILAKAVDLMDKSGDLDKWCLANLKVLEDIGLWMEHPDDTQTDLARFGHGWCHLQIVPPKSGRRVFRK